ncbi:MAG: hypothetical protein PHZ25_00330 [Candidatus Pacebacteria bacterium]|nr:hypothetical protein [Candidatus Paceibacterota bacterium]
MADLLKLKEKKRICQSCKEVIREEIYEDSDGKCICKSCWVALEIEKSKVKKIRKMDFSFETIEFKSHFCIRGQGFNLSIKSGKILDERGNLLPENKICFFVDVSKNGFYKELREEKEKRNKIIIASNFFHKGEQYFYRLKIPLCLDKDGNFLELGAEEDFERVILPSAEFIRRGLHLKERKER